MLPTVEMAPPTRIPPCATPLLSRPALPCCAALCREFLDPLAVSHFNVEGTLEFSGMLFTPGESV